MAKSRKRFEREEKFNIDNVKLNKRKPHREKAKLDVLKHIDPEHLEELDDLEWE